MSDEIYRPLIEDIVWSYSNLESFHDCRYRWFLRYIKRYKSEDKFYASYGLFMHAILEKFYRGEMSKDEMLTTFLTNFSKEVLGTRPKASIVKSYIQKGTDYLKNFAPLPYKIVSIEERIDFNIDDIKLTSRIDYIGEDENGDLIIVDNKSRDLKPRSGRKNPTIKDKELDSMLKQLYLYSAAVKFKYGKFPKYLCFNCFKPYVSNSFHCHVSEPMSPIEKQDKEERFWDLFNGGKIQYCRYNLGYNKEAVKTLVLRAMDKGFYEGVNLAMCYCEDCGYQQVEMDTCPKCGSKNITKIDRMNGYLGFTRVHGETRYNEAKNAEIADRLSM